MGARLWWSHWAAAVAGGLAAVAASAAQGLPEGAAAKLLAAALFGAVAAIAAALGVRWATRALGREVGRLVQYVSRMQQGERPPEALLSGLAELVPLARALARLSESFSHTLEESASKHEELQAILASLGDGCIAVDAASRVLLFNAAAARLFHVSSREALGRPILEVIRNYELATLFSETLTAQEPRSREFRLIVPQERVVQVTTAPIRRAGAGGTGAVALVHDVTELRRLERVRTDFVANVSHELRTPLTSIKGFVEALQEGAAADPALRERFLGIIARETDRLVALIGDLLDLSRLESKQAEFRPRPVSIRQVAEGALALFRPQASEKGIRLEPAFAGELPEVLGDPDMLRQVFINLLDNAIKYTGPGGRVWVTGRAEGDFVAVTVGDTGVGIPPQHLDRIFERFYRVDKARSRELGGTGLGLSIVKHIVERHGGRIQVQSTVGEGSLFTVFLPVAAGQRGASDGQQAQPRPPCAAEAS